MKREVTIKIHYDLPDDFIKAFDYELCPIDIVKEDLKNTLSDIFMWDEGYIGMDIDIKDI